MTDQTMTPEQALEWLEGLRNTTGDQVCAEIEAGKAAEAAQAFRAALSRPAVPELLDADKVHAEKEALDVCPHGVRRPHECKECADAVPASEALEWAEREFAAARQSPGEPVPVAWLVDYGDGSDPEVYVGERPPGVAAECSMTPLYPASVKAERDVLRERVKEALEELITWIPSADTYRRLGFDPEAPMRALGKARAALAKENRNGSCTREQNPQADD